MTHNIKLDKRLRAVVDCVKGDVIVDVGCDHGKVSLSCLSEGRAKKVIACDISAKSLQKAVDLAKTLGIADIDFRVGDGLSVIFDNEADCAVVAGMGGSEIMKILSDVPKGIKSFVLSPQKNVIELREFLSSNNFYIDKDFIVEEAGKFYVIIVAEANGDRDYALDRDRLLLGGREQSDDFDKYISLIQKKYVELSTKNKECIQCKLYQEMLELAKKRKEW